MGLWLLLVITIAISFNHLWGIDLQLTNGSASSMTTLADSHIEIVLAIACAVGLAYTRKNLKNRSFISKRHIQVSLGRRQLHFRLDNYFKLLFGALVLACVLSLVFAFFFFNDSLIKLFELWTQNSQNLNYDSYYIIGQLPFLYVSTPTVFLLLLSGFWLFVLFLLLSKIKSVKNE